MTLPSINDLIQFKVNMEEKKINKKSKAPMSVKLLAASSSFKTCACFNVTTHGFFTPPENMEERLVAVTNLKRQHKLQRRIWLAEIKHLAV